MRKGAAKLIFVVFALALLVLLALYFWLKDEPLRVGVLLVLVIIALFTISLGVREVFGPESRLRKSLKELEESAQQESSTALQQEYLRLYDLYLKLSERQKQNFYARISAVRETLEKHLQNEKHFEVLLAEVKKGTLVQRRKAFQDLKDLFEELPLNVQERYFPEFSHVKEELEKGV